MQNFKPLDNRFEKRIIGTQEQVNYIGRTRQPSLLNWFEFNDADVSVVGDNHLEFANTTYAQFFAIGDRVRIKLNSSADYTYFFVMYVDGINIYLDKDLSSSDTIASVAYSKLVSPSGFPGRKQETSLTFSGNLTDQGSIFSYYMIGSRVFINVKFDLQASGAEDRIEFDIPIGSEAIQAGATIDDFENQIILFTITGTNAWLMRTQDSTSDGYDDQFSIIYTAGWGGWSAGNSIDEFPNWSVAFYS